MRTIGEQWIERYISAIQWFIPANEHTDPTQLTRVQTFVNAVLLAALAGPLYAMAYYLLGFSSAAQVILLSCLVMAITPLLLRWTNSMFVAREVFLSTLFFNFSWLSYHLGGLTAPTAGWLITGPVIAMFLGGAGCALFWMCMSCAAVSLLYVLAQAGVPLPSHPVQRMEVLYLVCHIGLFLVMVVFMLLFELTKNQGFIKLEQALQIINELAIRDELTGTHNRRHLIKLIETEKERTVRLGHLFCLCLLDIDFFKRINDTYGHSTGDMVLREFAQTVQRQIRDIDSFGRYGGEEFLLMLPETSIDEALTLAERVRVNIEKMGFGAMPDLVTTVSIGVAQFRLGESIAQTVARADEALYLAKSGGRNRVVDYNDAAALAALEGAERATPPCMPDPAGTRMVARFDASQCDPLTGLLNRRMLRDRLNHAIERAARNQTTVALMLLNLNKFKEINDALGYEAGDAILSQSGQRIRRALRESDTIARWGGDEFIVLLEDLNQASDADQVAEKILDQFAEPFAVGARESFVTLSVGIAVFPATEGDMDFLLKCADIAMTRAKSWGDNIAQVYSSDAVMPPNERLALKNGLREALGGGQLFLEYQPQVDLATRTIVGVEALIRWQHPIYGRIEPVRFVPLAEETGMIVPIGDWVLRTACEQNRRWVAAGLPSIKMAVNLSARQLKDAGLVARVLRIVAETGIAAGDLDLELTEGILIDNLEANRGTMAALRAAGLKISIDDFGTGYSSLNYLSELPADILKMDGSFVRRLGQPLARARPYVIAESIIEMAHRLNLKVIAEAVETAEQLSDLDRMQCDEAQGYFFNRALHPDQVAVLLARQAWPRTQLNKDAAAAA
ncbi:bifunctional diguanylate cyclase/phosphodiesterase [Massilia sp. S19_KUP03_FR1]|uniref:bifunctional diguanylate cyclase/phosphodiesterase n=1 Tax=Massilia sp. S19_KUP03_FR1 TaxID=3025503 RepID=UPI002FCD0F76